MPILQLEHVIPSYNINRDSQGKIEYLKFNYTNCYNLIFSKKHGPENLVSSLFGCQGGYEVKSGKNRMKKKKIIQYLELFIQLNYTG